ncbi:hypothetical protein G5I_10902 [Acromyrmex echinatior]|uniref:Uncharacterized protein n=1 Tax=Acromyrmex echinatior TaxID=103372 RepID=F4WYB8_ACREC|nr:hypothetical protein G5I_10902 [Acromyrmex echinatior]
METGHPDGLRARARVRTLYDVLALLSRPRYSQWQDNERPRGSSRWKERLLGDVAVYPVGVPGVTRYRSLASKVRNFPLPTPLFPSHPREDKKDFIERCGGVTGSRMQLVKALVKVYTVITRTPTFSGLIFIEEGFPVIG